MVLERAELSITPQREAEFESQFVGAVPYLRGAAGCHSVTLARSIESPLIYLLLVEWDSVDAHHAFTKTEQFNQFVALVGGFFAGKPNMQHFSNVAKF